MPIHRDQIRAILEVLDLSFKNLTELALQAAERADVITKTRKVKARKARARRVRAGKKRSR